MIKTDLEYKSVLFNRGLMVFKSNYNDYVLWETKLGLQGEVVIGFKVLGRYKTRGNVQHEYHKHLEQLKEMEREIV